MGGARGPFVGLGIVLEHLRLFKYVTRGDDPWHVEDGDLIEEVRLICITLRVQTSGRRRRRRALYAIAQRHGEGVASRRWRGASRNAISTQVSPSLQSIAFSPGT